MYEPINATKIDTDNDQTLLSSTLSIYNEQNNVYDDEHEISNFIIKANEKETKVYLPEMIRISNPLPGELSIWKKRRFPKAMRIHKKREDTDPVKYFLSEMFLYKPFIDEKDLGSNDDQRCIELYHELKDDIDYVKSKIMPYTSGIEEARYYMEETAKNNESKISVGDILDSQNEQDNTECFDLKEDPHPDFLHLDPQEFTNEDQRIQKLKRSLAQFEPKSLDELLIEARRLDKYQKKVLNVAINFAQDLLIVKKGKTSCPKVPHLMVHGEAGSGKS